MNPSPLTQQPSTRGARSCDVAEDAHDSSERWHALLSWLGTASAVVGASANRQAGKQQAVSQQQAANQAAFESQAQLAQVQVDMTELADLKAAGVLTDDEFTADKVTLLA